MMVKPVMKKIATKTVVMRTQRLECFIRPQQLPSRTSPALMLAAGDRAFSIISGGGPRLGPYRGSTFGKLVSFEGAQSNLNLSEL